jgi:hypothetical protein
MFTTEHAFGRRRRLRPADNPGAKYSDRMETWPDISIECVMPAGTHTPRSGGTTHDPAAVCTVIAPVCE